MAWFLTGPVIAGGIALFLEPRWIDLCTRVDGRPGQCAPIDTGTMFGYALIAIGFVSLVLGPVANSLIHLFRHGQQWEATRHETAVSNLPILAGLLYLAAGFAAAALS